MATLSAPELAVLSNQLLTGQRSIWDIAEPYSARDFIEGLALCLNTLEERVRLQSAAQHRFRISGHPSSPDWNHDQHHFNTSELVTHLMGSLKSWQSTLRVQGLPLPEPLVNFPPTTKVTGLKGPGLGAGGRSDLSTEETMLELWTTRDHLLDGLRAVPAETWAQTTQSDAFGPIQLKHVVFLMAIHSAAHLFQLMEMQAQPEYPAG